MQHNNNSNNQIPTNSQMNQQQTPLVHFDPLTNDDFLEQILSNLPPSPWPELTNNETTIDDNVVFPYDNLASKFRNHQITTAATADISPTTKAALMSPGDVDPDILQMLSGNDVAGANSFKSPNPGGETFASASVQSLFNGFTGQALNQLQHPQVQQSFGDETNQALAGSNPVQAKPRVRARRGQATDPHSIAERLRRERIAERMKALQELVPNANKTDKASMLDEIIDYVKFLQIQVKLLSMSRLGGAAAVAPLVAQGGGDSIPTNGNQTTTTTTTNDSLAVTEHQVAKLLEQDMGSAMQYLQGKGLCLMPISLANAISTATCHTRSPLINGGELPSSPNMSVLTVQSAVVGNNSVVKETATGSKP